ncbi:ABC transporter permease [Bacteroides sp. OttesenSCG-928-E20]|nr:ABC transporter permease [Bacteroides sp. OttesenSCG-928-E20]MDL2305326.1 ABC transporter permease [Bacteroides sp. OttesenSCG-928-D19]
MLTIIIKQLWNKRRANGWLLAELFLVFIILWYVIDFLITAFVVTHQPKGYTTQHVYHVSITANPNLEADYTPETRADAYLQLLRQIENYPGVEAVCYYGGTVPYEEGTMFQGYSTDSVATYGATIRMVSSEFFDVFRVPLEAGSLDGWDVPAYPRPAIVSTDLADSLFNAQPRIGQPFFDYYWPAYNYTLAGIVPRTKHTEFDRYTPFIYVPVQEWMLAQWTPMTALRVRPEDEEGFASRFAADMRSLAIGPFYFTQIKAYDEAKEIYDTDINNYIRTATALILFFIFNIVLGVLGTFWFRIRKRRGEIGLRMAMGASQPAISRELFGEGVLLMLLAVIPAIVICLNLYMMDVTVNVFMEPSFGRFLMGIGITLLLLLFMVTVGVWYPARQAMAVQPAEALHEE